MRITATAIAVLLALASPALAQPATGTGPTFVYGVYGGAGRRTTSGLFLASALPSGATAPASDRATATLGFQVGVRFLDRVTIMGAWDQTTGGNIGAGHWGTMQLHAVGRVSLTRRVWIEAGGGASELGYKPPSQTPAPITRFWAPGAEASAGFDVLEGPRVALAVSLRYATATFHNLAVRSVAFQVGVINLR